MQRTHKFKTSLLLLSMAMAGNTFAETHNHTLQCGHYEIGNPVLERLAQKRLHIATQNKAAPFTDGAVRAMAVESTNIVDLMVYVHPTYIEDLSTAIRFDENGKPIENGAQFMHSMIQEQIDKVNEAFVTNNVDALYRVGYIHVLNSELPALGDTDAFYDEFGDISECASGQANVALLEKCQTAVYQTANSLYTQMGADTFHFIRSARDNGTNVVGLAGFFGGSAFYDNYVTVMSDFIANGDDQANIDNYLALYAKTTVHEVGHVLAANHPNEDTEGKGHQAHSCGTIGAGSAIKKQTVMAFGDTHMFFSDPQVTVDGEACGIAGVADNSDAVRTYAPLLAAASDKVAVSSAYEFTQASMTVDSGSGVQTIRLQRTGDLTQPASVALMAVDNTAWEQRDFTFGWKEAVFAAGAAYADVDFTVLERSGTHADSDFAVKMMYSTAGEVSLSQMVVNIESTDLPMVGSVTLQPATYSVAENAGSVTITLNRVDGTDGEAIVNIVTRNQTAIAGTDFTALNTTVTFTDGQESATVTVNVTNNSTYQGSRTFAVDITSVTTGLEISNPTATVTITDDETPPASGGGDSDSGSSGGSMGLFLGLALYCVALRKRVLTC
ncbi:Calx-beta domain-containing protein [Rheinheimera fenheensis]|uniref:Calx-beta domain-containing protein n=1 Tax=Rheinheimera fenheensis TaxID=3152295 RepID=UPI00325F44D7